MRGCNSTCGQRDDRRACLCSALRERSTSMSALAIEQGRAREKYERIRESEREGGWREEKGCGGEGLTEVTIRYFKLTVCATLINKKSLNFPRRPERKSGSILFPRIDVPRLYLPMYIFSPSERDTYIQLVIPDLH